MLEELNNILEEKVGYIQKEKMKILGLDCNKDQNLIVDNLNIQLDDIEFKMRNFVEEDNNLLQIIPIGVITNKEHNRVLVLKKQKKPH